MGNEFPECHQQLLEVMQTLQNHYRDMCDIEFTIEQGRLFLLQTRVGKRTAAAALRMAVEMQERGPHRPARGGAARRSPRSSTSSCTRSSIPTAKYDAVTKGLNASPGAAVGKVYFTADDAEAHRDAGEHVILVRPETSPDDLHGMIAAEGILTSRGGLVSHAAVVARGHGHARGVRRQRARTSTSTDGAFEVNGAVVNEGDVISINGTTGEVVVGAGRGGHARPGRSVRDHPRAGPTRSGAMKVRTNADLPHDAQVARRLRRRGHRPVPHRAHVPRRPPPARAAVHPRRRRRPRRRPRSTSSRSSSAPTSRASSRRWTACPSPSGCSTRRCTSSSPTSRSCSCATPRVSSTTRVAACSPPRSSGGRRTRCSAPAACRLGILKPGLYRMQAKAIIEAAVARKQAGRRPARRDHDPADRHRGRARAARRLGARGRGATSLATRATPHVDYLVGTMIETPRAALVAGEIAEVAEFFSFGTNDLTQMTFGFSRDDVEGRFMSEYLEHKLLPRQPVRDPRPGGRGRARAHGRRARSGRPARRSSSASAASTAATRRRSSSASRSGSTTCRARPTACRSPAWPPRTRPSATTDRGAPRRGRALPGRDNATVHAAAMSFDLHVPESRSLKAKRAAIRPIVDGLRHRFRVSVAEVAHHDQWQRAEIAVAIVAESDGRVQHLLDGVERFVAAAPAVELLGTETAWLEAAMSRQHAAPPVPAHGPGQRGRARGPRRRARAAQRPAPRARHHHRASTSAPTCARRPSTIPRSAERRSGVRGSCRNLRRSSGSTTQAALAGRGAAPARRARPSGAHEVHARSSRSARTPRSRPATASRRSSATCTATTPGDGSPRMTGTDVDDALARTPPHAVAGADTVALGVPRQPRRRRPRFDARALPRAARRAGATSWRRSRSRSSSRRTTASCPVSTCSPIPLDFPRRARRDGHLRLRLARSPRRSRARGQGRARADRARPPRLEHPLRHDQRDRSRRAAASGVVVRRLVRRARAAAHRRRRGRALRRAGLRHRPVPVRHHHAERVRPRARARRRSTSRCRACRASCSRSTASPTSSCSARRSPRAELDVERRFVWTAVTQDMLERHDVTLDEVEGLIDIVRRTTEAEVTCVVKEEADGSRPGEPAVARRRRRPPHRRRARRGRAPLRRRLRVDPRHPGGRRRASAARSEPSASVMDRVMRDGLVVVDKPAGCTSHDVVAKLRKVYGQRRVGHAGTLDPDATGVLLVGLGRATRLLRFLSEAGEGVPRADRVRHRHEHARRGRRGRSTSNRCRSTRDEVERGARRASSATSSSSRRWSRR